jgi:hypothetical protein
MPYFRWLGPTAIMPGFKQMVVKVKRQDNDIARSSTDGGIPNGLAGSNALNSNFNKPSVSDQRSLFANTPGNTMDAESRSPLNLPFYDTSPMPPSELITSLANTFFTHLGCNYPFLQRERFLRDLEEKQVDAILVDAVCAIAARFSTHPLVTQQTTDGGKTTPAEYGNAFANRAKTALVDTFSCPSVAAVQAALLLAYVEFGESRDSGLWMYLGISIRMAQDLGMHKLEGLRYIGKDGPTPKMIKRESMSGSSDLPAKLAAGGRKKRDQKPSDDLPTGSNMNESAATDPEVQDQADDPKEVEEQKAVERERVDTFWAVFFLDRMVSSGTGRRSTLRDKDIELSFPSLDTMDPQSGWPSVFPALIRIVHLYGRVADLLNSIKEASDITTETPKRLASMESQVTNFYQGLSARLHFDAVNFQHYMKAGEGTNFVLLHFWFHTLIVLLHQPTLLMTFEGRMLQLFPNSQQLSMSSAKTIADILSYSQLMDAKASLGNPFTTQPIYIAACAFLKETVEQTATSNAQSRSSSPGRKEKNTAENRPGSKNGTPNTFKRMSISELSNPIEGTASSSDSANRRKSSTTTEQPQSSEKSEGSALSAAKTANAMAKHTLLATAASQHYQLCYKALQSLETYWAGTKYILTVLDQKFQGVGDPLLYTVEEGESAMERPRPEPAFTSPGWRRKLSWGPYLYNPNVNAQELWGSNAMQIPGSPNMDFAKAIGWTLTGTMNSPSTNLAWHYPVGAPAAEPQQDKRRSKHQSNAMADFESAAANVQEQHLRSASFGAQPRPSLTSYPTSTSDITNQQSTDLNMQLHTQHSNNSTNLATTSGTPSYGLLQPHPTANFASGIPQHNNEGPMFGSPWFIHPHFVQGNNDNNSMQPFGDMTIESQDVDMSMLGLDMMPWFDGLQGVNMSGFMQDPGGNAGGTPHG